MASTSASSGARRSAGGGMGGGLSGPGVGVGKRGSSGDDHKSDKVPGSFRWDFFSHVVSFLELCSCCVAAQTVQIVLWVLLLQFVLFTVVLVVLCVLAGFKISVLKLFGFVYRVWSVSLFIHSLLSLCCCFGFFKKKWTEDDKGFKTSVRTTRVQAFHLFLDAVLQKTPAAMGKHARFCLTLRAFFSLCLNLESRLLGWSQTHLIPLWSLGFFFRLIHTRICLITFHCFAARTDFLEKSRSVCKLSTLPFSLLTVCVAIVCVRAWGAEGRD